MAQNQMYEMRLILDYGEDESKVSWHTNLRRTATDADFLQTGLAIAAIQGKEVKKIIRRDQFRLF